MSAQGDFSFDTDLLQLVNEFGAISTRSSISSSSRSSKPGRPGSLLSRSNSAVSTRPTKNGHGFRLIPNDNENPLTYLTTLQAISHFGYPAESHQVVTEDGYILTIHRIPDGKIGSAPNSPRRSKPVVFLQHGLFASSFEWLMNKQDNLLPLRLADAGYDVWLGNTRGNEYSRAHLNLTVKQSEFWEFSFNEIGKYDLPAEIDFVLGKTGEAKLHYVGFSMGTTMFFAMMSHRPEYNAKVKLMVALAPVAYLNHVENPHRVLNLIESVSSLKNVLQTLVHGEAIPPWVTSWSIPFFTKLCSNKRIASSICAQLLFALAGWDKPQVVVNQLPLFYSHTPSPTSFRSCLHLLQFFRKDRFEEYDFGPAENKRRYGKPTPPKYSLTNTTVPVALLYAPNDAYVNPIDVKRLASELPNVVLHSPINFQYWNHFDYHLGRDSGTLVNDRIMKLLEKYY